MLRNAAAGMDTELIYPSDVIDYMVELIDRSQIEEAIGGSHLTVLEHGSLPTDGALGLIDDRVALTCRDEEGVVRAMIDTDAPEAVAWFESLYEEVRAEARPVDVLERLEREG
jgi:hypothetical protein